VSLLEAKLADNVGMKWDLPFQGLLDCNSHIIWARFRSVEEMREDLAYKFNQIIYKFTSPNQIAKAYEEMTKVILELTDNVSDFRQYSRHYEWTLSMINNNKQEIIKREISKLINNEHFLTSVPINR
jgi:cyclopropane fatty-acyl-phospholipid synthase-like methyltransferase